MKISQKDYEILAEGYVAMLERGVITPKQYVAYMSTLKGSVGNAHPARPLEEESKVIDNRGMADFLGLWDEWEVVER